MIPSFTVLLLSAGAAIASAIPAPAPELAERASCTFTDAASAIQGKTSCSTIYLNGITVPAGTTLDLTKLKSGTQASSLYNGIWILKTSGLLAITRSSSKARQPSAIKNGLDL